MRNTKKEKIESFDYDELLTMDKNIFGLPFNAEESDIIIIPVPWDVTVSYNAGTADAPEDIKKASTLLDLFDYEYGNVWETGIYLEDISNYWQKENKNLRKKAQKYIDCISQGHKAEEDTTFNKIIKDINNKSDALNKWVEEKSLSYLNKNKIVGILGGEHSVPLGLIRALCKKHKSFSILQIDAHADLRNGYEGFEYSHASVMHHALKEKNISKLIQAGVRDIAHKELKRIEDEPQRIHTFFDYDIKNRQLKGTSWDSITQDIISKLEGAVYISFDIDGLEPSLCPNTGTAVPGGLTFNQVCYLLKQIIKHNKKIIGFDLCEVGHNKRTDWDANVGARILFKLCAAAAVSNGLYGGGARVD